MALHLDVTPPNTPPRSFLFSSPSRSTPGHPSHALQAWRWLRYTLIAFVLVSFVFGWPRREAIHDLWEGRRDSWDPQAPRNNVSSSPLLGSVASHGGSWWAAADVVGSGEDISTSQLASTTRHDPSLDYRRRLELTTSPPGYLDHSRHLGFSRVYVLSLPHRTDRRATMSKIAAALGIELTFVDAVPKESDVVGWIAERAADVRARKRTLIARHMGVPEADVGGSAVGSVWLTVDASRGGANGNQPSLKDISFPSLARDEYGGKDWVSYLWDPETDVGELRPRDPAFNVTEAMRDPLETIDFRQVSRATLSTFYNHVRVMRQMDARGDDTALVLEDDVDVEWDIERRWKGMLRRLPSDWEAVFLGHCWGRELFEPQYLHPNLHKSTAPLCLHGLATSHAGRRRLLSLFADPWLAFQTPVDTCFPTFIAMGLRAFSVEPPVVNQAKTDASDIQDGTGSKWKGLLADSTLERIWRDEGRPVPVETYEQSKKDPATVFRYCRPDDAFLRLSHPLQCPPRRSRHPKPHKRPPHP